nr:ParB/RepB/Spo0J family partition protein [Candidatus Njordarchaeota archaeon]
MDEVSIDQIEPSPYQLRLGLKTEDLKEEIQKDGLLSPLIVRRKNGYYELIDGQRRLEALKELGWKKVPVEIQEVDDKKARLMVYKLNSIRESYTAEEEARYFKRLADEGMKPYEIEMELGVKHSWVQACLNVWKFPEDIRNNIFAPRGKTAYQVYMSDIRDLEGVVNRNTDEAVAILREIIDKRVTTNEKQRVIADRTRKIDEARLKAVEQALPKIEPEISKLETPDELERAAITLRKEAKKRREETLSPEEKARIEAEKKRKEEERKRKKAESEKNLEEEIKKRARQLEEAEKRRIEEEARRKAREEALRDPEFLMKATEQMIPAVSPELLERASEAAREIAGPLGEALTKAEEEARIAKTSEERMLLESYMFLGSIIQSLKNRKIFCTAHKDEEPMLKWSCHIPITKTHEELRARLRLGK